MSAQPQAREKVRREARARRQRLAEVARRIADDARDDPARTLAESEVPAGGE